MGREFGNSGGKLPGKKAIFPGKWGAAAENKFQGVTMNVGINQYYKRLDIYGNSIQLQLSEFCYF